MGPLIALYMEKICYTVLELGEEAKKAPPHPVHDTLQLRPVPGTG